MYFAREKNMHFVRPESIGLWTEWCPPQIHTLKSSPPGPQNMATLGDRAF